MTIQTSGSYTANLLGNIRSHLAGLQGFDVMALELIQNADDAKAENIVFDIRDDGLYVTNSGQFSYCRDLNIRPCKFLLTEDYSCDYHRIIDVGSGGKLSNNENIGRFGIGFVSTYQVTDHPQILSAGIKLTLHPESGQWFVEAKEDTIGTVFFLPWATDPHTSGRSALGVSHITPSHIDQLIVDVQKVLRNSLLFLRNVKQAELRKNGNLILACDLHRNEDSTLFLNFRPSDETENWYILRCDAAAEAELLYKSHPRLETLRRSSIVSLGLRVEPSPLTTGLLYAFLPTEQPTGFPLHINGDFFPEADRKAVIFAGHQHEQAWNECLIDAAARELARDPEALLAKLGHIQLWQILSRSYELLKTNGHPASFSKFWERLKVTAGKTRIVLTEDTTYDLPSSISLPRINFNPQRTRAFLRIGGVLPVEELRPYQTAMNQLGAQILTLDRMVSLLANSMPSSTEGKMQATEQEVVDLFLPLCSILNDLLPDAVAQANNSTISKLSSTPFVLTENKSLVTISAVLAVPRDLNSGLVASLLPKINIASGRLGAFPKLYKLFKQLDLSSIASHIKDRLSRAESVDSLLNVERSQLRNLYSIFSELDRLSPATPAVYKTLMSLPIWLSSNGLISADKALLPGNFRDPTGQAELLDITVFTDSAREFLISRLGVPTQTLEAFVQTVLPRSFTESGPVDEGRYTILITELANHSFLLDDEKIRRLLGSLPLVPTQDGKWSQAPNVYKRTQELVKVLGDAKHLWLDFTRIPNARSVHSFIDNIGIRSTPSSKHLVERMVSLAKNSAPIEEARRASGDAFYSLCEFYDARKDQPPFTKAMEILRTALCFPADGDYERWHDARSLYAPYRSEAFKSQVKVLDFRNAARLNKELLQKLGVVVNPETNIVIQHLLHCVRENLPPHVFTYQILNERAQQGDAQIAKLIGHKCIHVSNIFLRPNQLYWTPQQLGQYAYTIPAALDAYKPFFAAIGVKNAPDVADYVELLLDIVTQHYERGASLPGPDRAVYDSCVMKIAAAAENDELKEEDLVRLRQSPSTLSLTYSPTHPDELLLKDSEWHSAFFQGELDQALCKPIPEIWDFLETIGVKRLTECADVVLEYVDGEKVLESSLTSALVEKIDVFARLLHDKPKAIGQHVTDILRRLHTASYNTIRIQASVDLAGNKVIAPPAAVDAFFNTKEDELIVSRPITARSWSHILKAIFHQLMPGETGIEISKLTLSARPLMFVSVEEAHRELSDAGIPLLSRDIDFADDLTSPELHGIGEIVSAGDVTKFPSESGASGEYSRPDTNGSDLPPPTSNPTFATHHGAVQGGRPYQSFGVGAVEARTETLTSPSGESPKRIEEQIQGVTKKICSATIDLKTGNEAGGTGCSGGHPLQRQSRPLTSSGALERDIPSGDVIQPKKRPKHKEQWDRRLLSYVRRKVENGPESGRHIDTEHNLAVEVEARRAVCRYERLRGRIPEQMPQTHPGYDILSRNPFTGELRYIEVKGVSGTWNETGVGLSRLQFSNAQDYGDKYWLYVVEFVDGSQRSEVFPICSPAGQISYFMFDGNWRFATTEEEGDPALAFVVGARIRHQHYGDGTIESIQFNNATRVMTIGFDNDKQPQRTITLNLSVMEVVDDFTECA